MSHDLIITVNRPKTTSNQFSPYLQDFTTDICGIAILPKNWLMQILIKKGNKTKGFFI